MCTWPPITFAAGFRNIGISITYEARGFEIHELVANGDWYAFLRQEILRLGGMERSKGSWSWPLAYGIGLLSLAYFALRPKKRAEDLACFGWQCLAVKRSQEI